MHDLTITHTKTCFCLSIGVVGLPYDCWLQNLKESHGLNFSYEHGLGVRPLGVRQNAPMNNLFKLWGECIINLSYMFIIGIWEHWFKGFMHETLSLHYAHHVFDKMPKWVVNITMANQCSEFLFWGLDVLNKDHFENIGTKDWIVHIHRSFGIHEKIHNT